MEDIIKYAMLLIYGLCVLIGYLVKNSREKKSKIAENKRNIEIDKKFKN